MATDRAASDVSPHPGRAGTAMLALIAAMLTSCVGGGPPATDGGSPPPISSVTHRPVSNPVDLTHIHPCSLLSREEAAGLGLERRTASRLERHEPRRTCTIEPRERDRDDLGLKIAQVLSHRGTEEAEQSSAMENYKETNVLGYPAIIGSRSGREPPELCDVVLDVSDTQGLIVSRWNNTDRSLDTCGIAERAAQLVARNLQTIKPAPPPPVDNPADLSDTDPCSLITADDAARFGLETPGRRRSEEDERRANQRTCFFDDLNGQLAVTIDLVLNARATETFEDDYVNGNYTNTSVSGFPAYLGTLDETEQGPFSCDLLIDVAAAQGVRVSRRNDDKRSTDVCSLVSDIATVVAGGLTK